MSPAETINYLEIPSQDLARSKAFFSDVFGWTFVDYGSDYSAFSAAEAGIDGGFARTDDKIPPTGILIVLYSTDLAAIQAKIERAQGVITQAVFSFPGGRRFHFTDPNGTEYAVWSDQI